MTKSIKTMKTMLTLMFVFWVISQGNNIQAQVLGTDPVIVNNNGIQCSSVGIGYGLTDSEAKANASKNRIKAEEKARKKGNTSFSSKKGGGSAVCIKYTPQTSLNTEFFEKLQIFDSDYDFSTR